jgi:hypothetical protein
MIREPSWWWQAVAGIRIAWEAPRGFVGGLQTASLCSQKRPKIFLREHDHCFITREVLDGFVKDEVSVVILL